MREIKFRAWDKSRKKMTYCSLEELCDNLLETEDIPHNVIAFSQSYDGVTLKPIREYMQFTGLKDKNGKEIYEGDVVKIHDTDIIEVVEYKGACFNPLAIFTTENIIEAIGNIYENPSLVKKMRGKDGQIL